MDFQAFSTGLGDDEELIQTAICCFLEEIDTHLVQLQAAISEQNATAVAKGAHTLKGMTALFAANSLVEANLALEIAAKAHRRDEFVDLFERMKQLTELLRAELRSLKNDSSHP